METIFTLNDEDDDTKINLDQLYENKQKQNLNTLSVFNKIIKRIHSKIKHISNKNNAEQYCWYLVPEIIIGIPRYNLNECTSFVIHNLRDNGFKVIYTHPNLLFISWGHWVPNYVRNEIKKKTGVKIDGNGDKIENDKTNDGLSLITKNVKKMKINDNDKYKDTNSYKPSGKLIYNPDSFKNIELKINNSKD